MRIHGPLGRFLVVVGLLLGGVVALAGGLALRGAGLVGVLVAAGVAAALAAGVVGESPERQGKPSVVEVCWQAAAWTVGIVLLIAGMATLAGGVVAALVTGTAVIIGVAVCARRQISRTAERAAPAGPAPQRRPLAAPPVNAEVGSRTLPPVSALPTAALGREWLRTTHALAGRLPPTARESIVRRRQETLDELERRDPVGFARWLAAGPVPGSDPAHYVRADIGRLGDQAAGTDAA